MSKKLDELLNSNYDGIQEYDNDLPRWWVILFYITIVFAVVYSGYVYLGFRPSTEEILSEQLQAINANKPAPAAETSADSLIAFAKDPAHISKGKETYIAKCSACHAPEAQGLVGPNLLDEYWIHGAKITDIKKTIVEGVPAKGMLTWKGVLSDTEIDDVAAYIYSLRFTQTNPANPKAPEGEKVVYGE